MRDEKMLIQGKTFTLPCPYYRWDDVKRLIP